MTNSVLGCWEEISAGGEEGGGAVLQELSETCCPITLSCFDAHHINEPNFKMTFCLVKKVLQMI